LELGVHCILNICSIWVVIDFSTYDEIGVFGLVHKIVNYHSSDKLPLHAMLNVVQAQIWTLQRLSISLNYDLSKRYDETIISSLEQETIESW